jgi:tRNA-binding EMAP/Myf-like protein
MTAERDAQQRVDLVVGRILSARPQPGTRAPSFLLSVDLGPRGREETTVPQGGHEPEALEGRQVVCAIDRGGLLVLAAHSHAAGLVFVVPEREVEDGTIVA